jgi:hypothetical protein
MLMDLTFSDISVLSAMLQIVEVTTKKAADDFLQLPWEIYKGNRYWVPPLLNEVKETLTLDENPFWQHARMKMFLAQDNGRAVGRITGVIDENHNAFHGEQTGFFGFFECIDDQDVARALWDVVRAWLKEHGMNCMRGPVNPSMNDENAFLLEGFDLPPAVMMPYTHEYYLKLAEEYGLHKAKDLYAFIKYAKDGIPPRIEKMIDRVRKRTGVTTRPFNMREFERDAEVLKALYNAAWEKNWGFVPMTEEEMNLAAKKLKQFADPELVLFAEIDGEAVGVSVTVPDVNQVLKRLNGRLGLIEMLKFVYYKKKITGVRSLIGGVKKEYRESGIIAVLYYDTEKAGVRLGYEWCELGWNLEDNDLINKFDTAIGGKIYKKYRIYEMNI